MFLAAGRSVCDADAMGKTWIVTGGCGFLGSNLTANLLADGIGVVVVDSLRRHGATHNLLWLHQCATQAGSGRLTFVSADVRNRTDIDKLFDVHGTHVEAVAHLAGQVAMTTSIESPRYDFEVNVMGAINVLEAIRTYCPEAVALFSSTNKVYGDLTQLKHVETELRWTLRDFPAGLPESCGLSFHSPYGCSKGAADQYFLDYHRMFGLRTVVFRHSSMYGGRQFSTFDQGWVGWFCQEFLRQKREVSMAGKCAPFTISGDGKQVRDLLWIDDAVACYRQAVQTPKAVGQVFNIGGGMDNSLSLLELFKLLQASLDHVPVFTRVAERASDQRVFVANGLLAQTLLGWGPTVSAREGVGRMLAWLGSTQD